LVALAVIVFPEFMDTSRLHLYDLGALHVWHPALNHFEAERTLAVGGIRGTPSCIEGLVSERLKGTP